MIMNTLINKKSVNHFFLATLATLLLSTSQAAIAKEGHLKVTSKVQKMVVVKKDGETSYSFEPTSKVIPGETLQYRTYFENISTEPTDNIKIVNPIPENLVYLENSAQGKNTNIVFSVDGGKNYGKAATLKVKRDDGKIYLAKSSDYTHIQWQYLGSLKPQTKQTVGFRARLL